MFALNLICEIAGRHAAGRFESFQAQAELIAMDWPNADQIPVTVCHLFSDRRPFPQVVAPLGVAPPTPLPTNQESSRPYKKIMPCLLTGRKQNR